VFLQEFFDNALLKLFGRKEHVSFYGSSKKEPSKSYFKAGTPPVLPGLYWVQTIVHLYSVVFP
jgi:hypothetical protein